MPTWLKEGIARHRAAFPPLPTLTAHIHVVVDDRLIDVPLRISEAKMQMLRSLLPGRPDGVILNELVDELLHRFGFEV